MTSNQCLFFSLFFYFSDFSSLVSDLKNKQQKNRQTRAKPSRLVKDIKIVPSIESHNASGVLLLRIHETKAARE